MRKSALRFFPRAGNLPAAAGAQTFTEGLWRAGVRQTGQGGGGFRNSLCLTLPPEHRRRADQQAQRPDSAAMGIDPGGRLHHPRFAFAAKPANGFPQGNVGRTPPALLSQRVKRRLQAVGRTLHQGQVQVLMRAVAAAIHQARLGAESRFVNQAGAGGLGQPAGPGFSNVGGEFFHYQLRNFAGGLYRPSDHSTRSATLPAASRERVASLRRIPISSG